MKEQKMNDATNLIKNSKYSLVVIRDDKTVHRSNYSGVIGLCDASASGLLKESIVFDTKIGLAAAKICVLSGVKEIHCLVASQQAMLYCKKNEVKIKAEDVKKFLYESRYDQGCVLEKIAGKCDELNELLNNLLENSEVILERAPKDGVFPLNYYTTSNLKTEIHLHGKWIEVSISEMDKGIRVVGETAKVITGNEVKKDDLVVVGEAGIKTEEQKDLDEDATDFGFMTSDVSTERAKTLIIDKIATNIKNIKQNDGRILLVGGPAIVHTGAASYVAKLIEYGFIDILFAGNALATHDLEQASLGTSLGISLTSGHAVKGGNHNHLRTINLIRYYGSIKKAIKAGVIKSGIMYQTTIRGIPYVLAGSIRDDGPLPEVTTDSQIAQSKMREEVRKGVDMAIMVATTLHTVATGNLLPNRVKKVVVDANPSSVIKLADRGTTGSVGLVTDCEFFFSQLSSYLI